MTIHLLQRRGQYHNPPPSHNDPRPLTPNHPISSIRIDGEDPLDHHKSLLLADVHFTAHTMHGLSPHILKSSPAVIFVWSEGEAYKHHIERLSQGLDGHEPEVSLAVRIRSDNKPADRDDEAEDNSTIDEFLSSHGFEYIDAARELPHGSWRTENEDEYADGIPHLPRVLDALGTIMWPSMQANRRIARDPVVKLLDDMSESQSRRKVVRSEETDDELEQLREHLVNSSLGGASAKPTDLPPVPSIYTWMIVDYCERTTGVVEGNVPLRFDDDFADFVSSPPIGIQSAPPELAFDRDSPNSDRSIDTTVGLQSAHAYQYQALRSSSGMGFGDEEGKSYGARGGAYDMANFDISKVISALQHMKAEIAGMENEDEKRKAAAKVALGLVYGLEAEAAEEE
ncbi:hypothetical protein BDQ17DRAFT_1536897 [Cyathus striatus]|nr:hypothetical protein BDQ17DRAFT_1536897 [Cyathus striatus]